MAVARFDAQRAESILLGVMQKNNMPVTLIQPGLNQVLRILYDNGLYLAGDIRYPAVQALAPELMRQLQQTAQQAPPSAPVQQPPFMQEPGAGFLPLPQQRAQQPFSVPGMQARMNFPPPPNTQAPPPPPVPQPPSYNALVPPGHPNSMTPITPVDWHQPPNQAMPVDPVWPASPNQNPPLPSAAPQGPQTVPVRHNPGLAHQGPQPVPVAAPMFNNPAPSTLAPNVVPGPFPAM